MLQPAGKRELTRSTPNTYYFPQHAPASLNLLMVGQKEHTYSQLIITKAPHSTDRGTSDTKTYWQQKEITVTLSLGEKQMIR